MRLNLIHQVFLLVIVPFVGVVGFVYFQSGRLLDQLNARMGSDLNATLIHVERELRRIDNTTTQLAEVISRSEEVVHAIKERQADFLFRWSHRLVASKLVDRITIADKEGVVLARGHDEYGFNDSIGDNLLYRKGKTGQHFSGISRIEGGVSLISVKPVVEHGAILVGVVLVSRNLRPGILGGLEKAMDIDIAIGEAATPDALSPITTGSGITHASAPLPFNTVASRPFWITVQKNYLEEQARYRSIQRETILVTVVAACLALGLVYLSVSYRLQPIRALYRWLAEYKSGKCRLDESSHQFAQFRDRKTELGFIANAAFSTLHDLEAARRELAASNKAEIQAKENALQANRELQSLSETLERRVADRTRALLEKSRLLEKEIAERKTAEQESRVLKNRLQRIFDAMPSILMGVDSEGKITQWNETAAAVTAMPFKQAVGRDMAGILDRFGLSETVLEAAAIQSTPLRQEVRISGKKRLYEITTVPFRADENAGMVIRIDDVTHQFIMEQEVLKGEKMKAIGVLAGGIAHDFNNLLASILGNIDLCLLDPAIGIETKGYLETAETACIRAKSLTQQLLTFSKGGDPIKETARLPDIIQESVSFAVTGGKISCTFSFPDELWPVNIDTGQIGQVLRNIVLNAGQAMPDGGELTVTGSNILSDEDPRIDHLPAGRYVRIAISDRGPGIPREILERIFDPYFSTKSDGNGLGLAICHAIMEKHGGHISAISGIGAGTTFYLYLPAMESTAKHLVPPATQTGSRRSPQKILVMDDEDIIQETVGAMLARLGHTVEFAGEGGEAIARYRESLSSDRPIDIVFMDLMVKHGMGGKEAVAGIIQLDPQARVIVSSGYSNDPIMAKHAQYGFVAAIAKPFTMKALMSTIDRVAGHTAKDG